MKKLTFSLFAIALVAVAAINRPYDGPMPDCDVIVCCAHCN
jgi:hypothetical protein